MMKNPQSIFQIAFIVILLKFVLGGVVVHGTKIPEFTGSDFAMAIAAIGSIHSLSKHVDNLAKGKEVKDDL